MSWSPRAVNAAEASFVNGDRIIIAADSVHLDKHSVDILAPTIGIAKLGVLGVGCGSDGVEILEVATGRRLPALARLLLGTNSCAK
jgi:hypothetical protein